MSRRCNKQGDAAELMSRAPWRPDSRERAPELGQILSLEHNNVQTKSSTKFTSTDLSAYSAPFAFWKVTETSGFPLPDKGLLKLPHTHLKMAENLVTQVTQTQDLPSAALNYEDNAPNFNSKIHLNIRGKPFSITRDELMSLPESILLSLFPNGVFLDHNGQVITNLTEEDIVFVNFDPDCFHYILQTFGDARNDLQENALTPAPSGSRLDSASSVLQNKPAIIVLREDLDFYVITPVTGCNIEDVKHMKLEVASQLVQNMLVFSGLGFDMNLPATTVQNLGPSEQHLYDMLCSLGFEKTQEWGNRCLEPGKCVLQSLSLVRLNSGEKQASPPDSPSLDPVTSNASTRSRSRSRIALLASSASRAASRSLSRTKRNAESNHTKLLLFWRKPARKCWWSSEDVDINTKGLAVLEALGDNIKVKVHIRRVWTLELSVVGVQ